MEALKDAFTMLKQRFRPDFHGVGNKDDARWRHTALLLHANKGDPYVYMQFAFELFSRHSDDVYPNMVTAFATVERFVKERPARRPQLEIILRSQAQLAEARLKNGESLSQLLQDPNAAFSAVFRFALAWSRKDRALAELFRKDAARMLVFEPLYKELLGEWLPEELRNV